MQQLPDDLNQVQDGLIDELWRHSSESIQLRLDSFQRNLQYLNANKHASGMLRYADKGGYRYVKNPTRELWLYVNLMRANLRLLVGALSSRVPQFRPLEGAADDYTISASKLAKELLQVKYTNEWQMLRQRALWYAYAGGAVGIWCDWDEDRQTTVETMTTLADMRFEPGSKLAETARWGLKQQVLPSGVVRAMYPYAFPEGDPSGDKKHSTWANLSTYAEGDVTRSDRYTTTVRTLYIRPSSVHPEGGFFVSADGKLVERGVWPFPWKDYLNVSVLRQEPYEDRWFAGTLLDDCTPLQAYINQVWSYLLTLARDTGAPIMVIPGDMRNQADQIDGRPGRKIFRRAGSTTQEGPYYVQPPAWPIGVYDLMDRAKGALDDMMDAQDVLRGRNAPNIESGAGVVALQQAAIGGVNSMSRNEAMMLGRVAEMAVKLHAQRVVEPRDWLISAEGRKSTRMWTGADLNVVSGIEVPVASLDPGLKEFMTQIVMSMIQSNNPNFDLSTLAKVQHFETLEQLIEETNPHQFNAIKENEYFASLNDRMLQAVESGDEEMVVEVQELVHPPSEADDHRAHVPEHNVFEASGAFRRLHPLLQEAFTAHNATHQREIMLELQNMMQLRQQAQVSPEGGGVPAELPA